MAKRKDSEPSSASEQRRAIDARRAEGSTASSASAPILELEAVRESASAAATESAETTPGAETIAPEQISHWRLPAYAPLAAAFVFAVALGAVAGAPRPQACCATRRRRPT
jgi:hypothetical protein